MSHSSISKYLQIQQSRYGRRPGREARRGLLDGCVTVTDQGAGSITVTAGVGLPTVCMPPASIKSITPSQFSLMPEGLHRVLTAQELADVVAFL